jgi:hypothetical protein
MDRSPSDGNISPIPTQNSPTTTSHPSQTSPKPTATNTPVSHTIDTTHADHKIILNYIQDSRQSNDSTTLIVVIVNAQYDGEAVTLSYNQLKLVTFTARGGLEVPTLYSRSQQALPAESGTVVIDKDNQQVSFKLTYKLNTLQLSQMSGLVPFTYYDLEYT